MQEIEVGNSPVLCICEVYDKVWMGCENGQLILFDINTTRLLLQVCRLLFQHNFKKEFIHFSFYQTLTKESIRVLSMVHITSLSQVYLGLDDGSILTYKDDLCPGLNTETPAYVKANPLMEYLDVKQVSSSLLAVKRIETIKTRLSERLHVSTDSQLSDLATVQQPMRITTYELWVGQRSGFVTVLNAETLSVITYIYNPFEISHLPSYVTFLVTNNPCNIYYNDSEPRKTCENSDVVSAPQEGLLTIYGAVYDGQFVTRWDVEKKSAVESYNCEEHLEEGEGKFGIVSGINKFSLYFSFFVECNITALHYSQLQLYVGLKSGKILIMNALKFNLIHCLDFHRGTVSSILSLDQALYQQQKNLANKDFSPELETSYSEVGPFHSTWESDSHISQLLTIGVGFKSYFDGVEAQAKLNSSFMLVWQADDWTHA